MPCCSVLASGTVVLAELFFLPKVSAAGCMHDRLSGPSLLIVRRSAHG